jgi:hypothetical protein
MQSKRTPATNIALGGVLAALAVVIMSMGTLIPVATYVCPMLCTLILKGVTGTCGKRIGWAWFGAVAILSLLMAPDKEAAAVFCVIGYYPIVKPAIDKKKLPWLWKGLLFNVSILTLYAVLMYLLGMQQILQDFEGAGLAMTAVTLALGNVTFFMLDRLLGMRFRKRK